MKLISSIVQQGLLCVKLISSSSPIRTLVHEIDQLHLISKDSCAWNWSASSDQQGLLCMKLISPTDQQELLHMKLISSSSSARTLVQEIDQLQLIIMFSCRKLTSKDSWDGNLWALCNQQEFLGPKLNSLNWSTGTIGTEIPRVFEASFWGEFFGVTEPVKSPILQDNGNGSRSQSVTPKNSYL